MEDEFIEDDYLEEDEGSGSSSRPFLMAVGALVTVFILAAVCTLAFLMARNRSAVDTAQVAAVETQNAETLAFNGTVTRQIAETETAQAMPTDTPTLPATNTSTPEAATETPEPTNTRVLDSIVGEGEEGTTGDGTSDGDVDGEGEAGTGEGSEGGATGTIVIGDDNGNGSDGAATGDTTTGGDAGGAVIGGDTTAAGDTDAQKGALPQTGFEIWGIALIGLLLVVVLIAANRLRTN